MSNFLEREIALISMGAASSDSDAAITSLLSSLHANVKRFSVADLATFDTTPFDGAVFNEISTAEMRVAAQLEKLARKLHAESKPIAAIGRSILVMASVFGATGIEITTGREERSDLITALRSTGAVHTACDASDFISDRDHKILSTPGSLAGAASAADVSKGVEKMVRELSEMA